jgi:hypothetical protein
MSGSLFGGALPPRPTYNHTRGDSDLTPCPECAALRTAMRALYIGIDPGATGAAVALDKRGEFRAMVAPQWKGKQLAPVTLDWLTELAPYIRVVTIEEPITHFNNANIVKSMMSVAMNAGVWVGTLSTLDVTDVRWIAPRSWQSKLLGKVPKGETKKASCDFAGRLFGATMVEAIKHWGDGVADAANIAEAGRQLAVAEGILKP